MKPTYRRMIQKYHEKIQEGATYSQEKWFVYILECIDGTFYTGITNDLDRRFKQHNNGRAARYTRTRLPVKLLYSETCENRSEALVREYALKSLPRKKKEELVDLL